MASTAYGKKLDANGKIIVDSVYGAKRSVMRQHREKVDPIKTTKSKKDKIVIEISEKKDSDGNLHVTTIKTISKPDWTKKTETSTEIIPKSEIPAYRKKNAS